MQLDKHISVSDEITVESAAAEVERKARERMSNTLQVSYYNMKIQVNKDTAAFDFISGYYKQLLDKTDSDYNNVITDLRKDVEEQTNLKEMQKERADGLEGKLAHAGSSSTMHDQSTNWPLHQLTDSSIRHLAWALFCSVFVLCLTAYLIIMQIGF